MLFSTTHLVKSVVEYQNFERTIPDDSHGKTSMMPSLGDISFGLFRTVYSTLLEQELALERRETGFVLEFQVAADWLLRHWVLLTVLITTAALTLKQYIWPFPLVRFIPLVIHQLCSNRMLVVISLFVGIFMTCVYGMGATLKIALPVAIIVSDCYRF